MTSAKDPDSLDPQDFGFLDPDPDPKNMRIHGSGSKGQNINQKLQKKNFTLKTQVLTIEKSEIIIIS